MFNFSYFKNKKWFLFLTIICTAFNVQCGESGKSTVHATNIGGKDNPFYFKYSEKEPESILWATGKFLFPIIAPIIINYAWQKYNEDPESTALTKKEREIALLIKSHPDYPEIKRKRQKIKIEEKENNNREMKIKLSLDEANLTEHHKEQITKYQKCENPLTKEFCEDMVILHHHFLEKLTN